jgi:hypothetical protein
VAQQDLWDKFWKDKHGDVVVYQHPNAFVIAWLVLTLVSLFTTGKVADIFWYVALAVLTVWALLEIFKGVNYLRRVFGGFVLLLIVVAAFRLA